MAVEQLIAAGKVRLDRTELSTLTSVLAYRVNQ